MTLPVQKLSNNDTVIVGCVDLRTIKQESLLNLRKKIMGCENDQKNNKWLKRLPEVLV